MYKKLKSVKKFGLNVSKVPTSIINIGQSELRYNLMKEENEEYF